MSFARFLCNLMCHNLKPEVEEASKSIPNQSIALDSVLGGLETIFLQLVLFLAGVTTMESKTDTFSNMACH